VVLLTTSWIPRCNPARQHILRQPQAEAAAREEMQEQNVCDTLVVVIEVVVVA